MKTVVLTGMMGSGKTTCGLELARRMHREFLDTDAAIERRTRKKVAEIFAEQGERAFRDLETQVCLELSGKENLVVATGGGLILRDENVAALKKSGVVIFLNRPAEAIYDSTSMRERPLAQDGREAFLRTFAQRKPRYLETCDVEIRACSTVASTVSEILKRVGGLL